MRKFTFKTYYLGLLFVIVVLVPAVILSFLAFRTASQEEAYNEKRLKATLLAELNHTVLLINSEVDSILQGLQETAIFSRDGNYKDTLKRWKQKNELVGTPFILSNLHEIIWPDPSQAITESERVFLDMNSQFFSDKKPILVYQNVAFAYQNEIIDQTSQLIERQASRKNRINKNLLEGLSSQRTRQYESQQQAIAQFEQYEPIRQQVYQTAQDKGKQVFYRNVSPQESIVQKTKDTKLPVKKQESLFVSEPLKFSQIIGEGKSGIISRIIDNTLKLIFWKKDDSGYIIGCMIDEAYFKDRIVKVLPATYNPVRILSVLDENGTPLIKPVVQNMTVFDWKRPFVALEISQRLPHWETVAYLSDPKAMTSQAHFTTLITWLIILIFLVSITVGGILVLRTLFSQIRLAQQKTTFVTNVSHELKTPLTSIRLFAELLKEKRQPDEEKQRNYLGIMVSETERLTHLINNVLDFAKIEEGKKSYKIKSLDVIAICRQILESQRVRLEHNGFKVGFSCELPQAFVNADEEALKQALVNLLSNAEKYSLETKDIELEVLEDKGKVLINIKDRGIGVPVPEEKNIFKEFYRVDDSLTAKVKGTGLGLTIAKRIINDQGGDIVYFPREGAGSVFQIQLPLL